jgi:hypothetical protein
MSSLRPGIQHRKEHRIKFAEAGVAGDMRIVIRPARDQRVERHDELALLRRLVFSHQLFQLLDMTLDGFPTRLDAGLKSQKLPVAIAIRSGFPCGILSDRKAQEIKARNTLTCIQGVCDSGFARFEF